MERRIFKLSCQLPHLDSAQHDNVKDQIKTTIEQFNIIHKSDWRDYFIGRMQQCNKRSSKTFSAELGQFQVVFANSETCRRK